LPQSPEPGKTRATVGGNQRKKKKITPAGGSIDSELGPALSDRQYDLLEALYRAKAFHADAKQTTLEVAQKAEGPGVNPEAFKEPIAGLKRLRLVDTKEGRGGGCWLTSSGRRLIKQIRKL
jgi:Mn-dependent DtxR family transcriptional regulator